VSVDERGEVVGKGDLRAQVEKTFRNIQACLEAAGATFHDVVKSNLYVVGLRPENVPIIREVRARYFDQANPPASTLVGVSALVGPDWLIEIEVIAVVGE
jgi:enamine deaminase RidA (YjgF/YER057c/UK114 family)